MYNKNMKKALKENKQIILTFVISYIIINILFVINEITPYGTFTTLKVDFFHQYGPMLKELWYRITHSKSLLYSFNMSMGLPIYRNFFNYLSSPFNILLIFFNDKTIITGYSFIIMLRVSFTACTFHYYLENKFKRKDNLFIFISLLYAFSNYFVSYYWNIMWMDGMLFIPLIVLGIENIVNDNKYLLYIISLSLMIISNYFIGYMCSIYSAIYFILYFIYKLDFKSLKNKKYIKNTLKKVLMFTISSLTVGLLVSFFALPLLKDISTISATNDTWPTSQYYSFSYIEYIINHLSCIPTTTFKTDITNAPNISCGIVSLSLLILFIFNKKIKIKTKIIYILILLSISLAFFIPQLDFIYHALHVPNDLPYRYSFLYSFTLMIICTYSILNIKDIKPYIIIVTYTLIVIFLFLLKLFNIEVITNKILLINFVLITIYFILYLIYYYDHKNVKYVKYGLILISSIEILFNINYNWILSDNENEFYIYYDNIENTIKELNSNNDNFYRIEKTFNTTLNDTSWYNYYGITTFSSMEYESMAILQHNLGLSGNKINSYEYTLNTPIYSLLFNIQYILGYNYDTDYYKEIDSNDLYSTYEFNYKTNLFYTSNKDIKDINIEYDNPIVNQNNLIKSMSGIDKVFSLTERVNKKTIDTIDGIPLIEYTFKNNNTNNYFYNRYNADFFIINDTLYYKNEDILDYIDNKYYSSIELQEEDVLINFKNDSDTFKILIGMTYPYDIEVYHINKDNFNKAYEVITKDKINIEKFNESYIKVNTNIKEDKVIFTSIPYDNNLKVYIDGNLIDTYKIDSLLAFDISKGKHNIVIKYQNNLMIVGTIISSITLLSLILIHTKRKN